MRVCLKPAYCILLAATLQIIVFFFLSSSHDCREGAKKETEQTLRRSITERVPYSPANTSQPIAQSLNLPQTLEPRKSPEGQVAVVQIYLNNCPEYLRISLWQARQFNERVILISDSLECREYAESNFLEFVNATLYLERAKEFDDVFPNVTLWGYWGRRFELMCYQRWFILQEFVEKSGIERVFYQDSDTMLYTNVSQENERYWKNYEIGMLQWGGMFSFFTLAGITNLCETMKEIYKRGVLSQYYEIPNWRGKIYDMECFRHYAEPMEALKDVPKYPVFLLNKESAEQPERKIFNFNIRDDAGFKMVDHHKQVTWIKGLPYFRRGENYVGVNALHFSGGSKVALPWYRRSPHDWQPENCTCDRRTCTNCWDLPRGTLTQPLRSFQDGGHMCPVEEIDGWPYCKGSLNSDSVVYSFGSPDDLQWENELIRRFNVTVFFFNPFLLPDQVQELRKNLHLQVHEFGLSPNDQISYGFNNTLRIPEFRLKTILRMLNHEWVTLLKLDGEYFKIDSLLEDPFSNTAFLEQIAINFGFKGSKDKVDDVLAKQGIRKHNTNEEIIFFIRKERV